MKKFLPAILCVAALAATLPARAAFEVKRSTLVERLDTCEAILQDIQSSTKTAIPADVLRRARGIVIVNQVQAGFFVGVKDGYQGNLRQIEALAEKIDSDKHVVLALAQARIDARREHTAPALGNTVEDPRYPLRL